MEKYLIKNKTTMYTFITAMISYIIVYGFELTHFTLSIDEEPMDNFAQTLSAGRWGHALLRHYILPEPYVPFFTLMLAIIILSATSALSAKYLMLSRLQSMSFAIALAAIPQMAYQLEFSNQSDTIAISMFCSVASLVSLNKGSLKGCITFIILTIVSLSIYQSIFLFAASLLCVWIAVSAIKSEMTFNVALKKVVLFSTLTLAALMLDAALSKLVASHYNVMISGYLSAIVGWGKSDLNQVINNLFSFIRSYFTFNAAFGMNSFPLVVIPLMAIIVGAILKRKSTTLIIFASIAVLLSAFLLNLAIGTGLPPRAMTQIPVVFAGIFIIAVVFYNYNISALYVSVILLAVGASASNKLFYSDYMARQADNQLSSQLINTIYLKYPSIDLSKTPVFFYGSFTPFNSWRIPTADVFGASFFEWDGGNNQRMYKYLSAANIADLKSPDTTQVEKSRLMGESLPAWPNRDAVALVDGVVIIKLSNKLSDYNK
ncbi:glucosyltransferase domain-containing protein [Pantoea sp. EABMAA-21]|jgi:hypothetical protein|uniref:glucosyltransferase domain-containing protein n=1 Tax=unclassified Pantoea TaxID=2630326 RepID=UPI000BDBEFE3|nr:MULTISPECIES: glucosyltransferase domain-containing protein [unclassified Pantoea]MDI9279537.1 glucosyltransferase domain-containing protein [Pantoea sp. EABMAA-21]SNY55015.1 Glucosyl transferase GtrII [Pantoea sp. GL120224-02]